ncbi:hypothetical protein D917_03389 [Trichinella nativa]|uniref:Uncharacterized protein n=1 Tax=Trichinella nativa TaxID=6335 RepID=A0A1Y3EE42_9BILA|nr:hypothetical protein D917_03389 [Trichinella nativa]
MTLGRCTVQGQHWIAPPPPVPNQLSVALSDWTYSHSIYFYLAENLKCQSFARDQWNVTSLIDLFIGGGGVEAIRQITVELSNCDKLIKKSDPELAWKKFPIPRLKDPHSRFAITYATISEKYPTTLLLCVLYPQLNKTAYLFVQNKQQSGEKMYACPARVVVFDQSTNK